MDMSEVRSFAAHLSGASKLAQRQARGVLKKGAQNIKEQLQDEVRRSQHFRGRADQFAQSITYDLNEAGVGGGGIMEAEIGPTKGSSGSLANIAYFGTSRGGGTVPDPLGALLDEVPKFEQALADLAADSI